MFVLAVLLASASACSKKVMTSSEIKTTKTIVYTDTLVNVKVPVPIKKIHVDTTLRDTKVILPKGVSKAVINKENAEMKVQVTIDSLGNVIIDAETKMDSVKAQILLKNKEIKELTEKVLEYEKKETKFAILVKRLAAGLGGSVLTILILVVIAYRIYRKVLSP